MIRFVLRALCLFAFTLSTCWAATALPVHGYTKSMRPSETYDRFIVRFKASAPEQHDAAARQRMLDFVGDGQGVRIKQLRRLAIGADVIRTERKLDRTAAQKLLQRLAADSRVAHVEIDALRWPTAFTNDTYFYPYQWHFWDLNLGSNLVRAWDKAKGSGVVVAVIDTGTTTHSDLSSQYRGGYDFISDSAAARDGDGRDASPVDEGDWTLAGECTSTNPGANSSWHGTHVAGMIAAVTNNVKGMAGAAPNATLLPLRVLGKCGGYDSDISDAIVWASGGTVYGVPANAYPAEVINLSLGSPGACSTTLQAAIDTAVTAGTVVVAAAGNDNVDASGFSPASCSNVIVVGATDRLGGRAGYSNYGGNLDVSAPGGDGNDYIYSTYNSGTTTRGVESYAGLQGTSMSAPQVAGTVALMQSVKANSPATVESILKSTARPLTTICSVGCGAGIIDALAAITAAAPTLSIDDLKVREGATGSKVVNLSVTLSRVSDQPVTFVVQTYPGTAVAGTDYIAVPATTMTIPAGTLSKAVGVTVNGNTVLEADKTFGAKVSDVVGATVVDGDATATIVEDDMGLSINDVSVSEGDSGTKLATFTVSLSQAAALPVTYNLATGTGGTVSADDYVAVSITAQSIPAGQTSKTFSVTVNGDTTVEPNEVFGLNASSVVGAAIADSQGIGTIVNDDSGPTLSVSDASITEGDSGTKTLTFTVSLSRASATDVSYNISAIDGTATAGSDYVAKGIVGDTIAAGATSKTFTLTINGDTTLEPDETLTVKIGAPVGAGIFDAQGTGTIINNEPTISIADVSTTEGPSGASPLANFAVKLSQPAASTVTCTVQTANGSALAGSDYIAAAGSVSIAAGQTSAAFPVTITGDINIEADETFTVNLNCTSLANATVTDNQAVGTIVNDDALPRLSVINDVTVVEGNNGTSSATFTVSLSHPSDAPVTFYVSTANITTAAGDFSGFGGVVMQTIPAGSTSKTYAVTINGDAVIEANETFAFNVTNPGGATLGDAQGIGTIVNDDGPLLSVSDASITEGNNGTTMMTFTVYLSRAADVPVTYDIYTADYTARSDNNDYLPQLMSQTIPAGVTSKSFSVPIYGDMVSEPNETFSVKLDSVTGASIYRGEGTGTIREDDGPTVSVANLNNVVERDYDYSISFYVTLSKAAPYPVTVHVTSADGTDQSNINFQPVDTYVTVPTGSMSGWGTVTIIGDDTCELNLHGVPDFYFFLIPATLTTGTFNGYTGVINTVDDDCKGFPP